MSTTLVAYNHPYVWYYYQFDPETLALATDTTWASSAALVDAIAECRYVFAAEYPEWKGCEDAGNIMKACEEELYHRGEANQIPKRG